MSATIIGQCVDAAASRGSFVLESEGALTVSNLNIADAAAVSDACAQMGWEYSCADKEGNSWERTDLDDAYGPFRIMVAKPPLENGALPVLSAQGFQQLLAADTDYQQWWVVGLAAPIRTWGLIILPWGKAETSVPAIPTRNPRFLVREYSTARKVPSDVSRWLLRNPNSDRGVADECRKIWSRAAASALVRCLANELDVEDSSLKFRGPPRLILSNPSREQLEAFVAGNGFDALQHTAGWIFQNERETETRHALVAAEIARSGAGEQVVTDWVTNELSIALEGARIAYEMSMAGLGADTLKALSDLRKAVTEETSKVTESTRQTIAAVAGALAVGIGLVAAKMASTPNLMVIRALMVVALAYVVMVTASGAQFVLLQRQSRKDWQARLYRFLPQEEYSRLVNGPTRRAEIAFWTTTAIGVGAVLVLAFVVFSA